MSWWKLATSSFHLRFVEQALVFHALKTAVLPSLLLSVFNKETLWWKFSFTPVLFTKAACCFSETCTTGSHLKSKLSSDLSLGFMGWVSTEAYLVSIAVWGGGQSGDTGARGRAPFVLAEETEVWEAWQVLWLHTSEGREPPAKQGRSRNAKTDLILHL